MVYSPPTLATLRASVATDLRDPLFKTFASGEVDRLINGGITEVSRAYPKEDLDSIVLVTDTSEYAAPFEDVIRCEFFRDGVYWTTIPPNTHDDSAQGGFELFGGSIHIPWSIVSAIDVTLDDTLRLWGYKGRDLLTDDADPLDGDADVEHAVRTYAILMGYQRLANSRALFQQWTQDGNNTDVSPTQLMGMAQTYESQWQRIRQQLRLLRRR